LQVRRPALQARRPALQARRPALQARRPALQVRRPALQVRRRRFLAIDANAPARLRRTRARIEANPARLGDRDRHAPFAPSCIDASLDKTSSDLACTAAR
jgi:hypothetical protein